MISQLNGISLGRFLAALSITTLLSGCYISVDVTGGLGQVKSDSVDQDLTPDISCTELGGDCNHNYITDPLYVSGVKDNTITLTATPEPSYAFDHWEGICGGSSDPICETTVSLPKNVEAVFKYVGGDAAISELAFRNADMGNCVDDSASDNGWDTAYDVTALDCKDTHAYITNLSGIQALPNVTDISIVGDCLLGNLACGNPTVTDLTPLQFTAIQTLRLERVEQAAIDDNDPGFVNKTLILPELPDLTELHVVRYGLTPLMQSFKELPNLQTLDVQLNSITDIMPFVNSVGTNFQALYIDAENIPCDHFQALFDKLPSVTVNDQTTTGALNCIVAAP